MPRRPAETTRAVIENNKRDSTAGVESEGNVKGNPHEDNRRFALLSRTGKEAREKKEPGVIVTPVHAENPVTAFTLEPHR